MTVKHSPWEPWRCTGTGGVSGVSGSVSAAPPGPQRYARPAVRVAGLEPDLGDAALRPIGVEVQERGPRTGELAPAGDGRLERRPDGGAARVLESYRCAAMPYG